MFVAEMRYPLALSLALGGIFLAQPALAHSHHHRFGYSHAAYHYSHTYARRHFAMAVAPEGWGGASWQAGAWNSSWQSPQTYWRHGWRGHLMRQASFQQTAWQQSNWQQSNWPQNGWQQNAWQQQNWRGARVARRQAVMQTAMAFEGREHASSTYYDYAPRASWSSARGAGGHSE